MTPVAVAASYFDNKQVAPRSRLKRLTPQDKIQYPTIDMAINLLLPPFTKIDRRQPIMDNYTDIQNYIDTDNYMLGSPYIQSLQQRSLPTTEASTNSEDILANARYKNRKLPILISNTTTIKTRVAHVWHAPTLHAKLDILKHLMDILKQQRHAISRVIGRYETNWTF